MQDGTLSKIIPGILLLILGIIESIGGLCFNDKRTKNDFTIELLSPVILPSLIQPGIFLFVIWFLGLIYLDSKIFTSEFQYGGIYLHL
jgi:hypothetical protein